MRGKVSSCSYGVVDCGITPAHAGKSKSNAIQQRPSEDHPRTCGEKFLRPDTQAPVPGSPPHMRGKAKALKALLIAVRITPAHAGKSRPITWVTSWHRDHPRTCGEKTLPDSRMSLHRGSPPHMRGKDIDKAIVHYWIRITPAHAGKRAPAKKTRWKKRDHPRTCGEKTKKIP